MGGLNCSRHPDENRHYLIMDQFYNQDVVRSRINSEKYYVTKEFQHNTAVTKLQRAVRFYIAKKKLARMMNSHIANLISNMKADYVRKDLIDYLHVSVIDLEQSGQLEDYKQSKYYKEKIIKQMNNKFLVNLPAINVETASGREIYEGFWNLKGKYEGYGFLVKSDGSKYEGFWKDSMLEGIGRYLSSDGSYFEGNFCKGVATGYGIFVYNNGTRYEGEWLNDEPHGSGRELSGDRSQFEGVFINGKKCGSCIYSWPDGSYYVGEIYNDYFNGKGRYSWKDGKIYEGEWKDNLLHGKGLLRYPDGSYYDGYFLKNQRNGEGKYSWSVDRYFEGSWSNGKQHGKGIYYKSGRIIEGVWNQGVLQKSLLVINGFDTNGKSMSSILVGEDIIDCNNEKFDNNRDIFNLSHSSEKFVKNEKPNNTNKNNTKNIYQVELQNKIFKKIQQKKKI